MKVQVLTDDGRVVFDSRDVSALFSLDLKGEIANALHDAQAVLEQDKHIIASIIADARAVIARIETELGANPAFTWAQTKVANGIAHLEHFVTGKWEEPKPMPAGVVVDERGAVIVSPDKPDVLDT